MSIAAIGLGAALGAGVLLVAFGVRGIGPAPSRWPGVYRSRRQLRIVLAGLLCGVVIAVSTGWPALGVLTAVGAVVVPRSLSGAERRAATERSEAVARWIEMLRDTIAGAAGLEEAVAVTARRPPPAIGDAVAHLALRLQHQPLHIGLRGFAAQVNDPGADLLVAALTTAATHETRDVGRLLSALVDATRGQARMLASIDAGRAQVRSATRLVLAITLVFTAALLVFSRDYLAPYATLEGQLWLVIVGAVFFLSLALLVRLDRITLPMLELRSEPGAEAGPKPASKP